MKDSLTRIIYRTFLLAWAVSVVCYFFLTLVCVRPFARHYEQEIYFRTASELARLVALGESQGKDSTEALLFLKRVNPDLEPFLLDNTGQIIQALAPDNLGKIIPRTLLNKRLSPIHPEFSQCGVDPSGKIPCPAFSVSSFSSGGRQLFVYLLISSGPSTFLESTGGLLRLARNLLPGSFVSFFLSLALAFAITKTFAKDVLDISSILERFSRLDFSKRFIVRSRDDAAIVGNAVNAMADSLEERLKELKETVTSRKRLLAKVVHDYRRPLSVITLLLERAPRVVASNEPLENEQLFAKMRNTLESERLILEGLKPLYETAESQRKEDHCSLPQLLLELAEELLPLFHKKQVSLILDIQSEGHSQTFPNVIGDRGEYLRAFLNLLDNALQYTPAGGSVTLSAFPENDLAVVEIRDTGCGISQDDLSKVFEPFQRTASSRESNPDGSGLGLSTVRDTIQRNGGRIGIRSELQRGTTVRCVLATVKNTLVPSKVLVQSSEPLVENQTLNNLRTGSITLKLRHFYLIEAATAFFILLQEFASQLFEAKRYWPNLTALGLITCIGILALCAKEIQERVGSTEQHQRSRSVLLLRFIRAVAFFCLGLLWISNSSDLGSSEMKHSLVRLVYAFSHGLLIGMSLCLRPFLSAALPLFLPLLFGFVSYFHSNVILVPLSVFLFSAVSGYIISYQASRKKIRKYSRRLLAVLICLFEMVFLPHLLFFFYDRHQFFFQENPAVSTRVIEMLNRELVMPPEAPFTEDDLSERVYRIAALLPRLDIKVFCERSRICATSPLTHVRFMPDELAPPPSPLSVSGGITSAIFDIVGQGNLRVLISGESSLSDKTIRRLVQPYCIAFIVGGFLIAWMQTGYIILSCFERLRRGLRRVVVVVESIREGKSPGESLVQESGAIGEMIRHITGMQKQLETLGNAVDNERRETREVVEVLSRTLERGRIRMVEFLNQAPIDLHKMEEENQRATALVQEVFQYSLKIANEDQVRSSSQELNSILKEAVNAVVQHNSFDTQILFEPSEEPNPTNVFVSKELAVKGIELLLRSLVEDPFVWNSPINSSSQRQIRIRLLEKGAQIIAHLERSVSLERDALWMLGVKTLGLASVSVEIEKDELKHELRCILRFPGEQEINQTSQALSEGLR